MGVGENLIRIPVGVESIEDIKPDCVRGLQALSDAVNGRQYFQLTSTLSDRVIPEITTGALLEQIGFNHDGTKCFV